MIKVALVCTASGTRPGSMRAYADTLCDAIDRHLPNVRYSRVELAPDTPTRAGAKRWETLALPFRLRREFGAYPDLWHVLDGSRAYAAAGVPRDRLVVTAHDIIPWLQACRHFPEAGKVGRASRALWRANARALRSAARVVCDSASTARDVQAHFAVSSDRCDVVPLPLRPSLRALLDRGDAAVPAARSEGIVLHVGNNAFYKNRVQVLELFAALDAALARRLVMLGPPPTGELREAMHGLALEARVTFVDDPDDATLADWYRRASLLMFPSLYEGYGWPVLEALSFGLPVVASDRGSLPEVPGAAAACLPIDDGVRMVQRAMAILKDPGTAAREVVLQQREALAYDSQRFALRMGTAYADAMHGVDTVAAA